MASSTVPLKDADWQLNTTADSTVVLPPHTSIVDVGLVSDTELLVTLSSSSGEAGFGSTVRLGRNQWTRFAPGLLEMEDTYYFTFTPRNPEANIEIHVRING